MKMEKKEYIKTTEYTDREILEMLCRIYGIGSEEELTERYSKSEGEY